MRITQLLTIALICVFLFFAHPVLSQGYIQSKDKSCQFYTTAKQDRRTFTYKGECKDGYVSGKATVTLFQDGSFYWVATGNFDKGILTGEVVQNFHNGHKFEGTFVNGNRSYGTYTFDDGRVYVGGYAENGKFNGKGVLTYGNGDKYDGGFVNEEFSGKGIYYFKNGDRFEGVFANNECRNGTMYYSGGKKEKGKLINRRFVSLVEPPIQFTTFTDAYNYLDTHFAFTPDKIENGYWIDPYLFNFNDGKHLIGGKCTGKGLEKLFIEQKFEEAEKDLESADEDIFGIEWSKIKSVTVSSDVNGDYWLTITGPVVNMDEEIQANELKVYVRPEISENVKNALLILINAYKQDK